MTKEDLKYEAEQYSYDVPIYQVEQQLETIQKTYLAGAEPREKRIKELEESLLDIAKQSAKQIDELKKENTELEEKISVLLSCKNCPENKGGFICQKEYEDKCLTQKIQFIKELQEENVELKAELNSQTQADNWLGYKIADDLEKAKEIIKRFSEFVNNEIEYDPEHPQEHTDLWNKLCKEVEQFLNSKVEND